MKKLSGLLLSALLLAACSEEEATDPVEADGTVEETTTDDTESAKPSQEELNEQLKEEATEVDFIAANGGEVAEGTKVKATGEATNIVDDVLIEFMLSVDEGDGYGVYNVKGSNTTDTLIEEGQTVTVFGSYNGKNDMGMPEIAVTIIE